LKFEAIFFDLFNTLIYIDNSQLSEVELGGRTLYTTSLNLYEQLQSEADLEVIYPVFLAEFERSREMITERRNQEYREFPCVERFRILCRNLGIPLSSAERMVELHMELMLRATYMPNDNRKTLDELKGFPLVLVSNFDHAPTAHRALRRHRLDERFQAVFISDSVGWRKPGSEFFSEVIAGTGFNPRECLYVGDDLEADVRGAVRQGFQVAWLNETGSAGDPNFAPRWVLRSLREVRGLVTD